MYKSFIKVNTVGTGSVGENSLTMQSCVPRDVWAVYFVATSASRNQDAPMTTVIAEDHDAFKSAGAEEDNSLAAVSAIADYQMHIAGLRGDVRLTLIVRRLAASTAWSIE